MKQTSLTCLLLFLLLCPLLYPVLYSWPVVNGVAVCTVEANQHVPSIVGNNRYGTIITWRDSRNGLANIYAQNVDSTGLSTWTTNGIRVCTFGSYQDNPKIVLGQSGGAIIAWEDQRGVYDVYAQSISSSGELLWSESGVCICNAANEQDNIQMISDGSNGAYIVWRDSRNSNWDIYAQRVNSEGSTLWTNNGVAVCTDTTDQQSPKIIDDGRGGLIVSWVDHRNSKRTIYAQALSGDGSIKWVTNGVPVCTADGEQDGQSIAINGAAGAYICWEDGRNGNWDIYAQEIDSTGNLKWGSGGLAVCTSQNDQTQPQIILCAMEEPMIAWKDNRDGMYTHIYAQRISYTGIPLWLQNGISVNTVSSVQDNPCIISDALGGMLIVWNDYRIGNEDIYAQALDMCGLIQLDKGGYAVVTAANDKNYQKIAMNGRGGAVITWVDYRNGTDYDIYAQNILNPDKSIQNVSLTPGNSQVRITWSTPTWANYLATRIVRRIDRYPAGPTDGTTVYWYNGTVCVDTGLINGLTYYYTIFAQDTSHDYVSSKTAQTSLTWRNDEGTFDNGPPDTTYWAFQKPAGVSAMPTISWESTFLSREGLLRINFSSATEGVKITAVHRMNNGSCPRWYHVNIKYATESTNTGHEIVAQLLSYSSHTSFTITEVGGNWTGRGQILPMTVYSMHFYSDSLDSSQQIQFILKNNGSAGDFFIDWIYSDSVPPDAISYPRSVSKALGDFDTALDTVSWGFESLADAVNGKGTFSWLSTVSEQTGVLVLNFNNVNQGVKMTCSSTFQISSPTEGYLTFKFRSNLSSPTTLYVLGYLYSERDLATFKVDLGGKGLLGNFAGNQWNTMYVPLKSVSVNSSFRMQLVVKNNSQSPETVYIDDIQLVAYDDSLLIPKWAELLDEEKIT